MKRLGMICLFMLAMLWFWPAHTEAGLSQSLGGADSLSIGTPFTLIIDTDFTIREVAIPDTLTDFKVVDKKLSQTGSRGKAELTIIPMNLGPLSFPKLEVKPQNLLIPSEFTDAFRVYVLSTRADSDTLLRDIKPLKKHPWQPPFWLYTLMILTALTLAIILIINALRRKPAHAAPKPAPIEAIPTSKPAWEIALSRLDALIATKAWEQDMVRYHFELSNILREFLESTYRFNAMEMTTREIAQAIDKIRPAQSQTLIPLLQYTDAVKFAKVSPAEAEILSRSLELKLYLLQFVPTPGTGAK